MAPNRSGSSASNRPANRPARALAPSGRTFTQKTRLRPTAKPIRLSDLRHTKTDGGSAESEEKALTVAPVGPSSPRVVTTVTDCATWRIASINKLRSTMIFPVSVTNIPWPRHTVFGAEFNGAIGLFFGHLRGAPRGGWIWRCLILFASGLSSYADKFLPKKVITELRFCNLMQVAEARAKKLGQIADIFKFPVASSNCLIVNGRHIIPIHRVWKTRGLRFG